MSQLVLSKDQEIAYKTIAKWLADGGVVHPKQKDPQLLSLGGYAGSGKALDINTPIPTPNGWTIMGELKIGDVVFSDDGKPCSIIAISEIMTGHDCFEFEFSDGTKVIADSDHIWKTKNYKERTKNKQPKERISKELFNTQRIGKHKRVNHSIDIVPAIEIESKKLPIDPYLLGVWLGDGAKSMARISSIDNEIIDSFKHEYNINKVAGENCDWGISSKNNGPSLKVQLRTLNLLFNKHIPTIYLRSSKEQRMSLLRGLMDTDGTVSKDTGIPSFTNTNKQLAIDTLELIRSLGFHSKLTTGKAKLNGIVTSDKYTIHFSANEPVFRLLRKKRLQKIFNFRATYGRKYITNVRKIDSVPVKCIAVDSSSKMYLCSDGFTPTHNTTLVSTIAKEFGSAIRFAFCALSGRAASILGVKLQNQGIRFKDDGHYCGTIHRLIYRPIENSEGEVIFWAKKESLDYDVIVMDEASMVSEDIFRDLKSYGIDILAVGDHGQLPPIEGKFSLMSDPILKLEKIHRQAADNPIISLSMHIRESGRIPKDYTNNDKVQIVKKGEYIDYLKDIYSKSQDPEKTIDTAVLCYTNATRSKLNIMIRNMVFGNISSIPLVNDIVICLRNAVNNRKVPLYNGFRGYLLNGVQDEGDFYEGNIRFPYEGFDTNVNNLLKYQFGYNKTFSSFQELENFGMDVKHWSEVGLLFDYGYSMTVHKAQGSQMSNVVLFNERPAPVSDDNYKRWLYTATTRSSDKLTIIL